jgi:hypothetical protein
MQRFWCISFETVFATCDQSARTARNSTGRILKVHIRVGSNWSRYSDSLRAGRSGDQIPVEMRFSSPVQTGPGAHPASYTMGTGSFPGVERPGRGVDHPPPSRAEVKERVELYLYSPSGPSWPVIGRPLPLPFITCD